MSGRYRPARDIRPGWHVRSTADSTTGGAWMPVLIRIDTVTDDGHERIRLLSTDCVTIANADDHILSRTPDEAATHAA